MMRGLITERDWRAIDKTFPEAHTVYSGLSQKPRTFLDLLTLCHLLDPMDLAVRHHGRTRGHRRISG